MKKISILTAFMLILAWYPCFATNYVSVNLNSTPINLNMPARIINGTTMVPMRSFFDEFGAKVYWYDKHQMIVASYGSTLATMKIGSNVMLVQDAFSDENAIKTLDAPPLLIDGNTFIPLRAAAECFNAQVLWDSASYSVNLTI